MPKLEVISHIASQVENRLSLTLPASTTEAQQEVTFHVPMTHFRIQIKPQIASFLEEQQREWKLNVHHDMKPLPPSSNSVEKRNEPVFETSLHYGVNRIEVTLVAALPKGEKAPNGLNMELERFVVHLNLLRHS